MNALLESLQRASLEGAVAIVAVWLICRAFQKIPAWTQSWLWRLAFLKTLFAFATAITIEAPLLPPPAPMNLAQFGVRNEVPLSLSAPMTPKNTTALPPPQSIFSREQFFTTSWISGALLSLAFLLRQFLIAKKIRSSTSTAPTNLLQTTHQLATKLYLATPTVLISPAITKPLLMGILKPTIIFPADLEANDRQLALMLAHELAHIKRRDLAWNWLAATVQTILWFHPLVWLAAREWRLTQEMACDELALSSDPTRAPELGDILVDLVAKKDFTAPRTVAAGIIETKATLERRLKGMKFIQHRNRASRIAAVAIIVIAGFAALPWRVVAQKGESVADLPAKPGNEVANTPTSKPAADDSIERAIAAELDVAQAELQNLRMKYKDSHPAVIAARKRIDHLRSMSRSVAFADPLADSSETERSLLLKEIELAQKQLDGIQRQHQNGAASTGDVAARMRDLQHLQRELAALDKDSGAYRKSLETELDLLAKLKDEAEKRVQVGVAHPNELIDLDREALKLRRQLASLSKGEKDPVKGSAPASPEKRYDSRQAVELFPLVSGRVVSVTVKPGSVVRKGQSLVHLDDRDAMIRLRTVESKLKIAEAELRLAELTLKAAAKYLPVLASAS